MWSDKDCWPRSQGVSFTSCKVRLVEKKVFPEFDPNILLDINEGLETVVKLLNSLPQLCGWLD